MKKIKKTGLKKKRKKTTHERSNTNLYPAVIRGQIEPDIEKSLKNFGKIIRKGLFSLVKKH